MSTRGLALLVAVAGLAAVAGCGGRDSLQVSAPPRTVVHHYAVDPAAAAAPPVDGRCFYASLSDPGRRDAWRCSAGNTLYDPCFTVAGAPGLVFCATDPRAPVQPVRLTEALPARPAASGAQPWALQLVDGPLCVSVGGGTMTTAAGRPVTYLCGRQGAAGAVTDGIDTGASQWVVDFVPPGGAARPAAVAAAWS